jgi:hypothetical protein
MKQGVKFHWTQEHHDTLNQLIEQVTSKPALHHPDPCNQFKLYVDVSTYALGGVLAQHDASKKLHAIFYLSKALTEPEQNYSIAD